MLRLIRRLPNDIKKEIYQHYQNAYWREQYEDVLWELKRETRGLKSHIDHYNHPSQEFLRFYGCVGLTNHPLQGWILIESKDTESRIKPNLL